MPEEERDDYFRCFLMEPFRDMWLTLHVPMKAREAGGYDVVVAAKMLGYLDVKETSVGQAGLLKLMELNISGIAERTLLHCKQAMRQAGLQVKAERLHFGAFLADLEKLAYTKCYSGFGGIPGYIQLMIYPNDYNVPRIPAIVAHEFHHTFVFLTLTGIREMFL